MKKTTVISAISENFVTFESTYPCDELFEKIKSTLTELCEREEVTTVASAMNLGIETLAAEAALAIRPQTGIKLQCVIPFEEQATAFTESERDRYFGIIERCDEETMIDRKEAEDSLKKCYDYLVQSSDIILVGEMPEEAAEAVLSSGKKIIYL